MKKVKLNKMTNVDAKTQEKMREILAKRQVHPNPTKQHDTLAGTAEVKHRNLIAHSEATETWKAAQANYLAKRNVMNAKALLKAATDEQTAASKSGATIMRKDRIEGSKVQAMATLDKEIGKSWRFTDDVNKALGITDKEHVVKSETLDPRTTKFPPFCKSGRRETMGDGTTRNIFDMD